MDDEDKIPSVDKTLNEPNRDDIDDYGPNIKHDLWMDVDDQIKIKIDCVWIYCMQVNVLIHPLFVKSSMTIALFGELYKM